MSETRACPYCGARCDADFVDVGVGMIQCGPYHCLQCGASEIGPYDKTFNPYRPIFREKDKPDTDDRILTKRESETFWYEPNTPPGSSANVIGGQIVSHRQMRDTYREEFEANPKWHDKEYVDEWWKNVRCS